jgi:AcrR family transcriptional regulator
LRVSPEKKQEKDRVRMELMRATLQLAAQHGYSALGLREVARQADIAPTSFYRHFADVEELGFAVVDNLVEPALTAVIDDAQRAASAGKDALHAMLESLLRAALQDAELMRFILAERHGVRVPLRHKLQAQLARLAEALAQNSPGCTKEGAARAAVLIFLDGCDALLDLDVTARVPSLQDLAARTAESVRSVLGLSSPAPEEA